MQIGQENRGILKTITLIMIFILLNMYSKDFILFHHLVIILLIMLWFNIKVEPKVILNNINIF